MRLFLGCFVDTDRCFWQAAGAETPEDGQSDLLAQGANEEMKIDINMQEGLRRADGGCVFTVSAHCVRGQRKPTK